MGSQILGPANLGHFIPLHNVNIEYHPLTNMKQRTFLRILENAVALTSTNCYHVYSVEIQAMLRNAAEAIYLKFIQIETKLLKALLEGHERRGQPRRGMTSRLCELLLIQQRLQP